jgi:chitin disaccharide deacetylase
MKNLIINADDFGMSKDVNFAILAAMDLNLCKDTTLLVNFEASEHAAKLAIATNRKNNIGIHINLTEGYPLTYNIRNESRFCNNEGLFHNKKNKRIYSLSKSEKKAVYEEIESQIQFCRKLGIPISHADSHNHIHEEPGFLMLLLDILKKEKIPFIRLTNNIGSTSLLKSFYRNAYNSILNYNNLAGTDYFGSIKNLSYPSKKLKDNSFIELMIHPGKILDNQIYDVYSKENLSALLPAIIDGNRLMSYHQLPR